MIKYYDVKDDEFFFLEEIEMILSREKVEDEEYFYGL